jgi:hypothetical protein
VKSLITYWATQRLNLTDDCSLRAGRRSAATLMKPKRDTDQRFPAALRFQEDIGTPAFARWHEPDDVRMSSPDLLEARVTGMSALRQLHLNKRTPGGILGRSLPCRFWVAGQFDWGQLK